MTEKKRHINVIDIGDLPPDEAEDLVMTHREVQRQSFAYGNTKIHNKYITREIIADAAKKVKEQRIKRRRKARLIQAALIIGWFLLAVLEANGWFN